MSAVGEEPVATPAASTRRAVVRERLRTSGLAVWRGAVADKVSAGRLRDVGWPYGLRAVVLVGLLAFVVAAGLALLSVPLRRTGELVVPNSLQTATPAGWLWLLVLLLAVGLALLHVAAIHGPWWSCLLGLVVTCLQLGFWGVSAAAVGGFRGAGVLVIVLLPAVIVFSLLRRRRAFAWWEFPIMLVVVGGVVALGLAAFSGQGRDFGFSFAPVYVEQLVQVLQFFVLPAALAAGAAVAEIAVSVTILATRQTQRLSAQLNRPRLPYVILAVVVGLRLVQVIMQLVAFDPVQDGLLALLPAVLLVAGFAVVSWAVITTARRSRGVDPVASELPEGLSRIGLPVAVSIIGLQIPLLIITFVVLIIGIADPAHRSLLASSAAPQQLIERGIDVFRLLLGVVLIVLALRWARRGRVETALLLGATGVMLGGLAVRLLTGYRWALWLDPDAINLVATLAVLITAAAYAMRGRLTGRRALALAGVLIISALFSSRDFVSDPVGALLGYSGVALVLFGVVWDFLTASDWANGDSRRFPRPTRVLLVLTYSLLTVVVVAYAALVRRRVTYADLDAYASLGDLVLGTALLAAAAATILSSLRRDETVA